ncbi:UPF0554 protein C2orf43-like protein [Zancudomyces culisetae]|uniref:UPF0554 protein C2orf43-like protein n=1 Tax=Zancudomyces culisetae TaxID=1213189 RepID=A0A1R1PYI6_ZANCU|nr:UPF0554 protein C2orf43-like protein [Zancudomyces culisetae]|eukprot:OMH86014.1 UPF0554 protein C2orf43-like protein [Zancudomyces culisetae]
MARPQTVKNCASMAIEEMNVIKDLDTETYTKHKDKFIMYFGTSDSWVPLEHYETIRKYTESSQTHLCEINMTHSFCIALKWI